MFLLIVQPIRFPLIQLATGNPLIDPFLLIALALINFWRFRLSKHQRCGTDRQ